MIFCGAKMYTRNLCESTFLKGSISAYTSITVKQHYQIRPNGTLPSFGRISIQLSRPATTYNHQKTAKLARPGSDLLRTYKDRCGVTLNSLKYQAITTFPLKHRLLLWRYVKCWDIAPTKLQQKKKHIYCWRGFSLWWIGEGYWFRPAWAEIARLMTQEIIYLYTLLKPPWQLWVMCVEVFFLQ